MGNSASAAGFVAATPRKLPWGHRREDTVKLEDLLTEREEDLWGVKGKRNVTVKKVRLARAVRYVDLAVQKSEGGHPNTGEMLNPAFVGDQGP